MVIGRHPTCNFLLELEREKAECDEHLNTQNLNATGKGVWCKGLWDNIACWEGVEVGGVVTISCPSVLTAVFGLHEEQTHSTLTVGVLGAAQYNHSLLLVLLGAAQYNHSSTWWSRLSLYSSATGCPLIALPTGSAILCLFRRLHCTRNLIHLNLFVSFILRASAVLLKDHILFSHSGHCSQLPSLVGCKASMVFFQYSIMANFYWLLVEGLYLHTLLFVMFSENRSFVVYLLLGWGVPTVFVFTWVMTRVYLEDSG
ncbi:hypothetical protein CRUP_024177 [Coryphaenoides rupestris]|nr:hypothetical protein CRUP_024177 [Coryphaenoides rupestris]